LDMAEQRRMAAAGDAFVGLTPDNHFARKLTHLTIDGSSIHTHTIRYLQTFTYYVLRTRPFY